MITSVALLTASALWQASCWWWQWWCFSGMMRGETTWYVFCCCVVCRWRCYTIWMLLLTVFSYACLAFCIWFYTCGRTGKLSSIKSISRWQKRSPYNKNIILFAGWLCWWSGRAHVKQHDALLFESFAWTLYYVSLWCYCYADMIMLCQFLWCSSS